MHVSPIVLLVGRLSEQADGVRTEAFAIGQRYLRCIEQAGGLPLMAPPMPALVDRIPSLLDRVDALVLAGGGDIHPGRYGHRPDAELSGIVAEHDQVELAVIEAAIRRDLPALCVCRGLQVLNVARGGTLRQHIGDDHSFVDRDVALTAGSRVASAMRTDRATGCHCVHHQAIERLGESMVVTGRADDGTIEAAELDTARWIVGTQWHPEDTASTDDQHQRLFDELVRQARTSER